MKQAIRRIVTLLIIALAATIIGCEKDDIYPYHYEQVIINGDYYLYSDSKTPEKDWVEYWNGDYKYYFEVEGTKVILYPTQKLIKAEYFTGAMDRNPVKLEVINNSVSYESDQNGIFRFIY